MKKAFMSFRKVLLIVVILLMNLGSGCIPGVLEYEIWLIHDTDGSSSYYGFYVDVVGVGIDSVTVTAPSTETYTLEYEADEAAWSYGKTGQDEILSEFVDGIYTINVTYTDSSTEVLEIELGGTVPPLPVLVSIENGTITWEEWVGPEDPEYIEVDVQPVMGFEIEQKLSYTETSYDIPDTILVYGMVYEIEILFLSSKYPNGYKASELNISYQH